MSKDFFVFLLKGGEIRVSCEPDGLNKRGLTSADATSPSTQSKEDVVDAKRVSCPLAWERREWFNMRLEKQKRFLVFFCVVFFAPHHGAR